MPPHPADETVLSVDLGGSSIKLGVVAGGEVVAADSRPVTGVAGDLDEAIDHGVALLGARPLAAVGVAVPGVVDAGRLVGAHDKYDWAHGVDLAARVAVRLGRSGHGPVPVVVENDARAALVGETTAGCAVGARDAVMIILGTGIGTAVLLDGRLLSGRGGHRGILGGHLTVTAEPIPCNCGNTGCAEAIGGSWNLAVLARGTDGWSGSTLAPDVDAGRVDLETLFAARRDGDAVATALSDRVLWAWRTVAVDLCHAYAPEVLIFSGGGVRAAGPLLDGLTATIGDRLWSTLPRPQIRRAEDPSASVLLGLAALVAR